MPLTIRGAAATALGALCIVVAVHYGIAPLASFGVLLLSLVALSVATLYLGRWAHAATRTFSPGTVQVDEPTHTNVDVAVRGLSPVSAEGWSDAVSDGLLVDAAQWAAVRGGHAGFAYELTSTSRGIHTVGPLTVAITDVFGIARRRHTVPGIAHLTVTPRRERLGSLSDTPGDASGSMHAATRHAGEGTDNLIPRSYLPGDSMRRIHWRSSAHHDALMVRQEEQEHTPHATVVLDRTAARWPAAAATPGSDASFEQAVSLCLSAAVQFADEGYDVAVIDADGTVLAPPLTGTDAEGSAALGIALATVVADAGDQFSALAHTVGRATMGPVVVITGHCQASDAEALTPLAQSSSLPLLFVTSADAGAAAELALAGWNTARLSSAGLPVVWAAAVETAAHRVD